MRHTFQAFLIMENHMCYLGWMSSESSAVISVLTVGRPQRADPISSSSSAFKSDHSVALICHSLMWKSLVIARCQNVHVYQPAHFVSTSVLHLDFKYKSELTFQWLLISACSFCFGNIKYTGARPPKKCWGFWKNRCPNKYGNQVQVYNLWFIRSEVQHNDRFCEARLQHQLPLDDL